MRFPMILLRAALLTLLASRPGLADGVPLSWGDLVLMRPSLWTVPDLVLPDPDPDQPILGPRASQDGARLLRHLGGSGKINGFAGILYDNRDRGHSLLDREAFPIASLEYGPDLAAKGLDAGLAGRILFPAVVLGNSSMAMRDGPLWRSLPRLAMTNPFWQVRTLLLYANNHVYVYPEHRDHDRKDLFPLNWPYMIVSQGSSGSDQAFLGAAAMTLAAFPAETFAALDEQRLVAPTLQMILRRTLSTVSSREDYLSGVAHPPVFDGKALRPGQMVAMASEMRPGDIPPLVRLQVVEETFESAAGLADLSERLLDSPSAIGRLWRGFGPEREMVVSAAGTVAPNDRPLQFEWRLLRGDPERVRIEPQGPDGASARIRIAWHAPWIETGRVGNTTYERQQSRVDIGVFANNGVYDSAPAFISVDFPEHQRRDYADTEHGERLVSIDYDAQARKVYFDPLLYWSAPWTDTARYDEAGVLLGWDRRHRDGESGFVPLAEDRLPPALYDPEAFGKQ